MSLRKIRAFLLIVGIITIASVEIAFSPPQDQTFTVEGRAEFNFGKYSNQKVQVTITEDGSSSTWDITTIPDEYQIKENFSTVSPGAEVKLEVTECTARLRWCEVVCC